MSRRDNDRSGEVLNLQEAEKEEKDRRKRISRRRKWKIIEFT